MNTINSKVIVNKIGGGILSNNYLKLIPLRIKEQIKNKFTPIIVVSAFPHITDDIINFTKDCLENPNTNTENYVESLLKKHEEIISFLIKDENLKKQTIIDIEKLITLFKKDAKLLESNRLKTQKAYVYEDSLVAYGEKLSATIITRYLENEGIGTKRILAEEFPIVTDDNFKNANIIKDISTKNLKSIYEKNTQILVIPGFTGVTQAGSTTTLGRGGTDTAACFIGSALNAHKIILWKNVGGVLSCDPRIVKNARNIEFISYEEAIEAGKIIHEKAISYVKQSKTPIEIISIENPKLKTTIKEIKKVQKGAKIISIKKEAQLFLITDEIMETSELISLVGDTFSKYKTEITLISNTRYELQIVAYDQNGQIDNIKKEIAQKVQKIEKIECDMIFLVGHFDPQDIGNFNTLLIKEGVDLHISAFYYQNCTRMEAVIKTRDIEKVVKVVHKKFIK